VILNLWKRHASWKVVRAYNALKARYDREVDARVAAESGRLIAAANYERANRAVALLQAEAEQQERSTARIIDALKATYLARIRGLEDRLEAADVAHAEVSGQLQDVREQLAECRGCL
jgi:hypothetical protein